MVWWETGAPPAVCTNLGFCFDASAGWFGLSGTCHAQWKKSKPPRQDEFQWHEQEASGPSKSILESLPDLTRRQGQYVMGFLGVECAAPGGEMVLCSSDQSKQNLTGNGAQWQAGFVPVRLKEKIPSLVYNPFSCFSPFGECSLQRVYVSELPFSLPTGQNLRVTSLFCFIPLSEALIKP